MAFHRSHAAVRSSRHSSGNVPTRMESCTGVVPRLRIGEPFGPFRHRHGHRAGPCLSTWSFRAKCAPVSPHVVSGEFALEGHGGDSRVPCATIVRPHLTVLGLSLTVRWAHSDCAYPLARACCERLGSASWLTHACAHSSTKGDQFRYQGTNRAASSTVARLVPSGVERRVVRSRALRRVVRRRLR